MPVKESTELNASEVILLIWIIAMTLANYKSQAGVVIRDLGRSRFKSLVGHEAAGVTLDSLSASLTSHGCYEDNRRRRTKAF